MPMPTVDIPVDDEIELANLADLSYCVRCTQPACDYYRLRFCLRPDYPSGCVRTGIAYDVTSDE